MGADPAAGTADIFDHQGLADLPLKPFGEQPADDVGGATGGIRHDQGDGPIGIVGGGGLRESAGRGDGCGDPCCPKTHATLPVFLSACDGRLSLKMSALKMCALKLRGPTSRAAAC